MTMINNGLFSSLTDEWETPRALFDTLDREFRFDLDPCATAENAKCARFYTKEQDGLLRDWLGVPCFVNPPYGKQIGLWVRRPYREAQPSAPVVMLLPARTDTNYWHAYVMRATEIRLVKGRLRFGGATNSAPFPSAIVVFRGYDHGAPRLVGIDTEGRRL